MMLPTSSAHLTQQISSVSYCSEIKRNKTRTVSYTFSLQMLIVYAASLWHYLGTTEMLLQTCFCRNNKKLVTMPNIKRFICAMCVAATLAFTTAPRCIFLALTHHHSAFTSDRESFLKT
ncbi:hypothetical protein FKM82_017801 [Ascaphus truei]